MDFERVVESLGEFGWFQKWNYFLACLPVIFTAMAALSFVFTAAIPQYRCFVPNCDTNCSMYEEPWLKYSVPKNNKHHWEKCTMFAEKNSSSDGTCDNDSFLNSTVPCNKWIFDNSTYRSTAVSTFSVTCTEEWEVTFVGTVYFTGVLFGSLLFGFLSDRFGRKKVLIYCIMHLAVTGIAISFTRNFTEYLIWTFLNALANASVFTTAFVIGLEFVGRSKRVFCGVVIEYFFAVGEAILGGIAWWLKDWRKIQLAISVPLLLFISYACVLPESVRWLATKRRYAEAERIIRKAARVNGITLPEDGLLILKEDEHCLHPQKKENILGLFQSRRLAFRSLNIFYLWIVNTLVYYGLSFNATTLGGNVYLNFILVSLIEIPGYTFSWILMEKWGRRPAMSFSFFISSIACICASFIPTSGDWYWEQVVLFLVGKFGITSSFCIVYLFSAELFPTVVRVAGLGMCSMCARIGGIVSPFIARLVIYGEFVPLLIFGTVGILAGFLTLLLPETLGTKLPDTIEDAKNCGRKPLLDVLGDEESTALLAEEVS